MIHPRLQWAIQIDVTNACPMRCSNCTRLVGHVDAPYFMDTETFDRCLESVKRFPYESEPCPQGRSKVVGLLGGEPLLHPSFPYFAQRLAVEIPDAKHRGLWTALDWPHYRHHGYGPAAPHVEILLGPDFRGYLNWNRHGKPIKPNRWGRQPADKGQPSKHQPILAASADLVPDADQRYRLIENCWVQREWSSTYTPAGFFPCEVMGHLDAVFRGPGGLTVDGNEWRHDMQWQEVDGHLRPVGQYAELIERWCHRCGGCVPLPGRLDSDRVDDVTKSNLADLQMLNTEKVRHGLVHSIDGSGAVGGAWKPYHYVQNGG